MDAESRSGSLKFNLNSNSSKILDWSITADDNNYQKGYLKPDILSIENIETNNIVTNKIYQSELQEKQNIDLFNKGLEEVIKTDICTYTQDNEQQIGFLIGDDYRLSNKLVSFDGNSINIINALAVAYKAIQELNEKIEGGMSQ